MEWTVETNDGGFEGDRLKKVIKEMVEHYGENDEQPSDIISITVCYENSREREICQNGIDRCQMRVEEGVEEWLKESKEAHEAQKDLESDYWASR